MTEQAFTEHVNTYSAMVYRIAFSCMKNRTDAEDVVQNVFLKLYIQDKMLEGNYLKNWLVRVTVNECKMLFRTPWHARRNEWQEQLAEVPAAEEDHGELIEAIMKLKKQERVLLYLFYYEGYKTSEIAQMLGKKESAVRVCLTRTRKKLKNMLGGKWNDEIQ